MRRLFLAGAFAAFATSVGAAHPVRAAGDGRLHVEMIDVEGGAATLFVTPGGRSLLIDAGWPPGKGGPRPALGEPLQRAGFESADRIAAAAARLGVRKLDYVIVTHYHMDHVGGLRALVQRLPVGTFVDHGENREPAPSGAPPSPYSTAALYADYLKLVAGHSRRVVKAGDELRLGSMTVTVVSADGVPLSHPLAGAGALNPACAGVEPKAADGGEENARSVASLIRFGGTRIAAYGDLSWNAEGRLACPADLVGPVDVLIVTQHGSALSSNPADVAALSPVVALMGNGAAKGGDPAPIATVSHQPSLQGFWRLHGSPAHPQTDGPERFIANPSSRPDAGFGLSVAISPAGEIQVVNERAGTSQTYRARGASSGR